jgi:hypothetical protein
MSYISISTIPVPVPTKGTNKEEKFYSSIALVVFIDDF